MTQQADRWSLVVPVKRVENAKTRLDLDVEARASLAVAMAVDTVTAALACPLVTQVVVVTDGTTAYVYPLDVHAEVSGNPGVIRDRVTLSAACPAAVDGDYCDGQVSWRIDLGGWTTDADPRTLLTRFGQAVEG